MESRGPLERQRRDRPSIPRRSCDHCRVRKIACDRALPCSNCVSARIECTHSNTKSNSTAPKQRVLISTEYERKIDELVDNVNEIRRLLARGGTFQTAEQPIHESPDDYAEAGGSNAHWDHSAHLLDFVRTVIDERTRANPGDSMTLASLKKFVHMVEAQRTSQSTQPRTVPTAVTSDSDDGMILPPLEATEAVLLWARDHEQIGTMRWVSRILPHEQFADICRKLYLPSGDNDRIDCIDLAIGNGYLSYMFSEHANLSGLQQYKNFGQQCRSNLSRALVQIPLVLRASVETLAALAIGAAAAIESSQTLMAWTFISAACSLCITLRYHRSPVPRDANTPTQRDRERLFWTIYAMDKALSLRLGRLSNLSDSEISLSIAHTDIREAKLGRIQGKMYEELYGPADALCGEPAQRRRIAAEMLAEETRTLIRQTNEEIFDPTKQLAGAGEESLRLVYLKAELVCQSSVLTWILHAASDPQGRRECVSTSDACIETARHVFHLHAEFIKLAGIFKDGKFLLQRYINWALLNIPFVAFNVLMSRSLQEIDDADLARLEGFTATLQPEADLDETSTHPHRLYKLLCQAVRCYIHEHTQPMPYDPTLTGSDLLTMSDFDQRRTDDEDRGTPGPLDESQNSHDRDLCAWMNEDVVMRQTIGLDEYLDLLSGSPFTRI